MQRAELHPDAWEPIIIRDPEQTPERLAKVAGDKDSYADLDDFSDLIARTVQGAPETSKVERRGVLPQVVYLEYSEARLAAYGLQRAALGSVLSARNIIAPGGAFETGQRQIILNPSGQFENIDAIGNVAVSASPTGAPVYLRDLVELSRGYQSPAQYLNYYTWEEPEGQWQRSRSVTLAIYMRDQAANRGVWSIRRPEIRSTQQDSSAGPDHRAYLRPATAGQRKPSSLSACLVRSDHPCRRC